MDKRVDKLAGKKLTKFKTGKANLAQFKQNQADRVLAVNKELLDAITPTKIRQASLRDIADAYAKLTDRHRLLTGQSTSNVNILSQILDRIHGSQQASQVDDN